MEKIIKKLAIKYGKREVFIRFLFTISMDNGNTLEESVNLIHNHYQAKVGVN